MITKCTALEPLQSARQHTMKMLQRIAYTAADPALAFSAGELVFEYQCLNCGLEIRSVVIVK